MKRLAIAFVLGLFLGVVVAYATWEGSTNFPTSLDDSTTLYDVADLDVVQPEHHDVLAQAIIAIETKLGIGSDTPTSLDVLIGDGTGSSEWRALVTTDISDISASASEINTPLDGALVTLTEFRELETIGATTISAAQWTALGALTATASEINTPLDGATTTLAEFQQLQTIGGTTISANQWAVLGGIAETLTAAEVNILDGVSGVTAAELSYIGDVTGLIQAQLDLKATIAAPVFTTSLGIGSAILSEAELEILDGATLDTTELNYLDGATGVIGTGNTVRSISPTFTGTAIFATINAASIVIDAAAHPRWVFRDSDGAHTDKTAADIGAGFSDTTSEAEISDFHLGALGAATAGTHYTHMFWDGSDAHLYMGVLANYTGANPSVAPLDVANYESLVWDFDYGTNSVGVTSPVSGTTIIDFTTLDLATTGLLSGGVVTKSTAANYTIGTTNAAESYGGVIYCTDAVTITIPAVAAGMNFSVITIGAVAVSVDPNGSDKMYLDGTLLDDGDKATNTSTTGDSIVCTYFSADGWYCMSGSPDGDNWTDGS